MRSVLLFCLCLSRHPAFSRNSAPAEQRRIGQDIAAGETIFWLENASVKPEDKIPEPQAHARLEHSGHGDQNRWPLVPSKVSGKPGPAHLDRLSSC